MVIGLHNHIYTREFFDDVSQWFAGFRPRIVPHGDDVYGFEIFGAPFRPIWANMFAPKHRFADMDRLGIDRGSFNFSNNADKDNDENLLIINDQQVAQAFEAEFQRVLAVAKKPR